MKFNEKLDFLMNITSTANSALALYASLDASYVSRLRRGERRLPKNENYVRLMASYFAKNCVKDYQKKALMELLDLPGPVVKDNEKVAEMLNNWLLDEQTSDSIVIGGFLEGLSHFQFKKRQAPEDGGHLLQFSPQDRDVIIRYGVEGKREAVLLFLSSVLNAQKPQTLLLYSDEDMEWLTDDPIFAFRWADLLAQVIMRGNRIRIIHTVSRNLDEMLEALSKWIPLYMTGAIDPYYYPKKRDGIFRRTMFIAPETAALTSTSVGSMAEKAANFLLKDPEAVQAITEEFNSYFNLCRPLMRIFAPGDRLESSRMLYEFEKESADAIIKTGTLSLTTIPMEVAAAMVARTKSNQKEELLEYLRIRQQLFRDSLQDNSFIEIINLAIFPRVKEGNLKIAFSEMLDTGDIYYTPDEFRLHLENIVATLQNYENYNVSLENSIKEDGYVLYVKEELGAIVIKTASPCATFAINESNMTAAFWDFLQSKIDHRKSTKERVIKELQKVIDEININK